MLDCIKEFTFVSDTMSVLNVQKFHSQSTGDTMNFEVCILMYTILQFLSNILLNFSISFQRIFPSTNLKFRLDEFSAVHLTLNFFDIDVSDLTNSFQKYVVYQSL